MRTFTFDTIADYRQAKYDGVTAGQTPEGVIHAALVGDSSVYSGSVVSKIKTGETFVDSINPFVTPDLGTDGDTLYKITDNGVVKYMYLRKGKTAWDSESFGQVFIKTDRLPTGSYTAVTNQSQVFTYADTKTEATGSGRARIAKIKGNSLAWNQLAEIADSSETTMINNVTITDNRNGSYTINGTASGDISLQIEKLVTIPGYSHKILFNGVMGGSTSTYFFSSGGAGFGNWLSSGVPTVLTSPGGYNMFGFKLNIRSGTVMNNVKVYPMFVDLTLLYGPAIDGLTDDQIKAKFEAEYPNPYYAYDAGSLLNFKGTGVKFAPLGLNFWDENYMIGGYLTNTGQYYNYTDRLCSKNPIRVAPNTTYYIRSGTGMLSIAEFFYDANMNFISYVTAINGPFTTPANCLYIHVTMYGTTTYDPVCINLSGPRNGQYEPYKSSIIPINITSLRDSNHNLIFPNGLLSAGTVYDEIDLVAKKAIKRVGRVDLGTLEFVYVNSRFAANLGNDAKQEPADTASGVTVARYMPSTGGGDMTVFRYSRSVYFYNSSYTDAVAFKAAVSGQMVNFELATPIEYDLSIPLFGTYPADEYVTKQLLPINGETPTTSPMSIEIQKL